MRGLIICGLLVTALSSTALAAQTTVTVWLPADVKIDAGTTRIATIAKASGQTKLTKACARAPGKFDSYSATILDVGVGSTFVADIVVDKLPGKGIGIDLSSLRAEGECKDGGKTWHRYTAVVKEPPVLKPKPAPEAPKKTEPKKKDK